MAESKVYVHEETPVTWGPTGDSPTELMTSGALAAGAGRQGALHDFGTTARSRRGVLRVWFTPGATRVVGEPVRVYWKTGDGTQYDNDDGTGDIAVSSINKLRNLDQVMTLQIDEDSAVVMGTSEEFEFSDRYGGPVVWNATANALAADVRAKWIPVPPAIQAEA